MTSWYFGPAAGGIALISDTTCDSKKLLRETPRHFTAWFSAQLCFIADQNVWFYTLGFCLWLLSCNWTSLSSSSSSWLWIHKHGSSGWDHQEKQGCKLCWKFQLLIASQSTAVSLRQPLAPLDAEEYELENSWFVLFKSLISKCTMHLLVCVDNIHTPIHRQECNLQTLECLQKKVNLVLVQLISGWGWRILGGRK